MGQFKPMVKMETTEPSIELKLKKGGSVKKADGGMMSAPPQQPPAGMPMGMPARGGSAPAAMPMAPSLAARRRAMKMMGAGPAAPVGLAASRTMKKGGMAKGDMESKADERKEEKMDMAQDKAIIKKAFKQHDMQEHKGGKGTSLKLKKGGKMATGGSVPSEESYGSYDTTKVYQARPDSASGTGGVSNGNAGGFKRGGKTKKYATGGLIPSEESYGDYNTTKVYQAKPDSAGGTGGVSNGNAGGFKRGGKAVRKATGGVMESNGGGYKRGGATKKHFATGGAVNNSGSAVAMPQGRKPIPSPVEINQLAGTYKKGGSVAPGKSSLISISKSENAPAMNKAKADSNLKYGPANKMKLKDGGKVDLSKGAYDATLEEPPMGMGFAKKAQGFMNKLFGADSEAGAGRGFVNPKSVTKSKESVTVAPMKKGGSAKC